MNEENNTTMTNDEVKHVYDSLSVVDKASYDKLNDAKSETENANYTSEDNNEIDTDSVIPGVNTDNKVENEYGLDDESMGKIISLMQEYKAGNTSNLYSRMPLKIKIAIDKIVSVSEVPFDRLLAYKNAVAKDILSSFMNDEEMQESIDQFNQDMMRVINDMNLEYDTMISDAIDSVFDKIDDIRKENPDRADMIQTIKDAFDAAGKFEREYEYAANHSPNKINKLLRRYEDSVRYFNTRVNNNTAGVKVVDINLLVPVIKKALPSYKEDGIKKFICIIIKTMGNTDMLNEISYIYRTIGCIYKYNFIDIDEEGEKIFNNISKVIDAIPILT